MSQKTQEPGPSVEDDTPKRRGIIAAAVVLLLTGVGVAYWYSQPRPPTVVNIVQLTNDGKSKVPTNSPATDGVHLYFIEGQPSTTGSRIAQLSATGGETTWIATTIREPLAIAGISPDLSQLLVATGFAGNLDKAAEWWVQPLPAGAPHRFGNVKMSTAIWTPDGMHIVYAIGHAILIANKDGSDPHQVTEVSGIPRGFQFSPDGRRIACVRPCRLTTSRANILRPYTARNAADGFAMLMPKTKSGIRACCRPVTRAARLS